MNLNSMNPSLRVRSSVAVPYSHWSSILKLHYHSGNNNLAQTIPDKPRSTQQINCKYHQILKVKVYTLAMSHRLLSTSIRCRYASRRYILAFLTNAQGPRRLRPCLIIDFNPMGLAIQSQLQGDEEGLTVPWEWIRNTTFPMEFLILHVLGINNPNGLLVQNLIFALEWLKRGPKD